MASTNIATLNILLKASANGLVNTFKAADSAVTSLSSSVKGAFTGMGAMFAGLGAAGAIGGIVALTNSAMDNIGALKDQSDAMGITTEALSRLQYAAQFAGVDAESLNASLGKMLNNISEARSGAGAAAEAFATLGLDAAQLAQQSPDEAFKTIADAMKGIENPAQRVQLAMDIFGKSGKGLIPILKGGADGLSEMETAADKLGVTVSSVDAETVDRAGDALGNVWQMVKGIGNSIAIQLSPLIEDASDNLTEWGASGEGVGGKVTTAVEMVAKSVAIASDYLYLGQAAWYALQGAALKAVSFITGALNHIVQKVGDVVQAVTGTRPAFASTAQDIQNWLDEAATNSFKNMDEAAQKFAEGKSSKAVTEYFQRVRDEAKKTSEAAVAENEKIGNSIRDLEKITEEQRKAQEKVASTLGNLKQKVDEFGMSESEKVAAQLKSVGATEEQIAQAQQLAETYEKLESAKKAAEDMDKDAAKVLEDIKTPLEKAQDEIDKLITLYEAGKLSAEQFAKAQDNLLEKAADAMDKGKDKAAKEVTISNPKLLARNSNEAFALINEITNKATGANKVPEQQLTQQKQTNKILERIERKGGAIGLATIDG
jgi:hypothetical protein